MLPQKNDIIYAKIKKVTVSPSVAYAKASAPASSSEEAETMYAQTLLCAFTSQSLFFALS